MDPAEDLWEAITFFIIPVEAAGKAVVKALGVEASIVKTRARRFALAETLQSGDHSGGNKDDFAIFSHGGFTWVAPPAMAFARSGDPSWFLALSEAFGVCYVFTTAVGAAAVIHVEEGNVVAQVSEFKVEPKTGVLGLTERIQFNQTVISALQAYTGANLRDVFDSGEAEFWKRTH